MTHELKLNRKFFSAVASGKKTFEIRKDEGFKVGDILILKEWDDFMNNFSGRSVKRQITYIYNGNGQYGLAKSYVILALKEVE